jgi:hypothetical protein
MLAPIRNALLASAFATSGCAGAVSAEPPNVEGQAVVSGSVGYDDDLMYVNAPPVVDIEAYPFVTYGGVNVYYVDGLWYRRGPRGWAYYRQEPGELGRQREAHWGRDHDPRWGVRAGAESRSGVTEAQPRDNRGTPSAIPQQRRRPQDRQAHPTTRRAPTVRRGPAPATAPVEPQRR